MAIVHSYFIIFDKTIMKKLLYILLVITFIGCSDSSENEVENISIVGTWYEIKTEDYGPATKFMGLFDTEIDPEHYIIIVDGPV